MHALRCLKPLDSAKPEQRYMVGGASAQFGKDVFQKFG